MRLKTSLAAAGLTAALILTGCAAGGGGNTIFG